MELGRTFLALPEEDFSPPLAIKLTSSCRSFRNGVTRNRYCLVKKIGLVSNAVSFADISGDWVGNVDMRRS